ncbi:dihydrofolate reductase family protein [Micromonospora sp. NPDC048871]|uniref:dihydrofolate reductase family protein n=1 Tax=unclassified Micromonospora TaxID=2617518 RepID=UPI002E164DA9|nr:dihydrofolate reductase family protein [Micromonospora sp. NBC_01739]
MEVSVGKVVLDMTMSVNGCVAGPEDEPEGLHDWFFSPSPENQAMVQRQMDAIGAMVMGRRTYDMGASQGGFVDNPFKVEHFIVSHDTPDELAKGDTSFIFVSDGVESAVRQAKAAAGDKDVVVGGGAQIAQQCLAAGLVDEIRVAVRPVLIDNGLRLFDNLGGSVTLESIDALHTPEVTHLSYRVVR